MVGLYEKNPKGKTNTPHTDKYYTPKKSAEEEIINGRLVDIGNDETVLSTQIIISEEQVNDKNTPTIVALVDKEGKLIKDSRKIEEFKNKYKDFDLYSINNPENPKKIGELTKDGEVKVSGMDNLNEKIIISKDSKISRILSKKDGMESTINRYGEEVNSHKKETKVYKNSNIDTQKGIENLEKQPAKSILKKTKEAKKIKFNKLAEVKESDRSYEPNTRKGVENLQKQPAKSILKEATKIGEHLKQTLSEEKQNNQKAVQKVKKQELTR